MKYRSVASGTDTYLGQNKEGNNREEHTYLGQNKENNNSEEHTFRPNDGRLYLSSQPW